MSEKTLFLEQVSFEIEFPEGPELLVNNHLLKVIYKAYLDKISAPAGPAENSQGRFIRLSRLKDKVAAMLGSVNNFEHVKFESLQDKNLAIHSLMVAISSGYVLGSMSGLNELAIKAVDEAVSNQQSERGKKSGASRRKKAEETWHPHAAALARKHRAAEPGLSQAGLASMVIDLWQLQEPAAPSANSVLTLVRTLERSGKLARRRNM